MKKIDTVLCVEKLGIWTQFSLIFLSSGVGIQVDVLLLAAEV